MIISNKNFDLKNFDFYSYLIELDKLSKEDKKKYCIDDIRKTLKGITKENKQAYFDYKYFKFFLDQYYKSKDLNEHLQSDIKEISKLYNPFTTTLDSIKRKNKYQYYFEIYKIELDEIFYYCELLELKDRIKFLEYAIKKNKELYDFLYFIYLNILYKPDKRNKILEIKSYMNDTKIKIDKLEIELNKIELSIQKAIIPQLIKCKNKTKINKYYTQLIKEKKIEIDLSKFLEHFDFTGTNINQDIKLTPISWKGKIKELIALIEEWIKDKVIEDTNYLNIITQHFVDKKGKTYKKTVLKTAKYKLNKKGYQI